MAKLVDLVEKIRSKNAGPFWLTVDIFCGAPNVYEHVSGTLETAVVTSMFAVDEATVKRFDIPSLNVVKFSMPRPVIQGAREDRDMHGAQWAVLLSEIDLPDLA